MRCLFVPSCEVAKKNTLTGTTTEKRLTRALKLWKTGQYDAIIVSGGIYLSPELQTVPSGWIMRDWLLDNGISSDKIICEDQSRDTYENISRTLELMTQYSTPHFTVVSHWQHLLRFWVTFILNYGIKIKMKPMFYWVNLKTFILEWPMLLIHIFDDNGTGKIASKNRAERTFEFDNEEAREYLRETRCKRAALKNDLPETQS